MGLYAVEHDGKLTPLGVTIRVKEPKPWFNFGYANELVDTTSSSSESSASTSSASSFASSSESSSSTDSEEELDLKDQVNLSLQFFFEDFKNTVATIYLGHPQYYEQCLNFVATKLPETVWAKSEQELSSSTSEISLLLDAINYQVERTHPEDLHTVLALKSSIMTYNVCNLLNKLDDPEVVEKVFEHTNFELAKDYFSSQT
eukprot:Phypoly_transcript_17745.p1 GENE.Phypoly_transcript_17745~~Phypoly_transcript_17745.p1  ORF type:complete len:223 (+),score=9.29 Phypoly_transcript_17745:64-669(+)